MHMLKVVTQVVRRVRNLLVVMIVLVLIGVVEVFIMARFFGFCGIADDATHGFCLVSRLVFVLLMLL